MRLHYTTLGSPSNPAVLVLHGTGGSGTGMLSPAFGDELFGPGQPLDAGKYFIILPDALGHGKSSKPSDGMRTKFPLYNYDDMVQGQFRLLTEGLGVKHLRLVIGNSMGGMQTWMWGVQHPEFMDALVPMASQPTEMSSRNWMMRRIVIDAIRNDPARNNGNYTSQPQAVRAANAYFGIVSNGGSQAYQKMAPTRAAADKLLDARLAAPFTADANDFPPLPVGFVTRLQPGAAAGAHSRAPARHQLGGRRTQSARTGHHGARTQATEEREVPSHSSQ